MKKQKIAFALSLLIVSLAASAYTIKDTLNPIAIYTGSNTTPTINAASDGTVTLGPTTTGGDLTHLVTSAGQTTLNLQSTGTNINARFKISATGTGIPHLQLAKAGTVKWELGSDNASFGTDGLYLVAGATTVLGATSAGALSFPKNTTTTFGNSSDAGQANISMNSNASNQPILLMQRGGTTKLQIYADSGISDQVTIQANTNLLFAGTQAGVVTLGPTTLMTTGQHLLNGRSKILGGQANAEALAVKSNISTSGQSFGLVVDAGTNQSDQNTLWRNQAATTTLGSIDGAGHWILGAQTTDVSSIAHLVAGTTTSGGASLFELKNYDGTTSSDATYDLLMIKGSTTNTTAQRFIRFQVNAGSTNQGQINGNGADAVAFGATSDRRLKRNIRDLKPQLDNIMALRPVTFDRRDMDAKDQTGFIAQEVQKVYPEVVSPQEDGMLVLTGWSKTEARLVSALQELKHQNDKLRADFEAYKADHQ